jgi:hypothetical protein
MRFVDYRAAETGSSSAEAEVVVAVTMSELMLLAGALGEAVEEVAEWELQTRLGASLGEVTALRCRLNELARSEM